MTYTGRSVSPHLMLCHSFGGFPQARASTMERHAFLVYIYRCYVYFWVGPQRFYHEFYNFFMESLSDRLCLHYQSSGDAHYRKFTLAYIHDTRAT